MENERSNTPNLFLFTDFGSENIYTGHLRSVLQSRVPEARIHALSNKVPRQHPAAASFLLESSLSYLPAGSYVLCVVDPGVGTDREISVIQMKEHLDGGNSSANSYTFVGPNNGMFSFLEKEQYEFEIHRISDPEHHGRNDISNTFHGRDIMAPVLARLVNGLPIQEFGSEVSVEPLPDPYTMTPELKEDSIQGEIIFCDDFGNAVSNIHLDQIMDRFSGSEFQELTISLPPTTLQGIKDTYGDVNTGTPLALIGSFQHLEVAVNHGSAREKLNISEGEEIKIQQ